MFCCALSPGNCPRPREPAPSRLYEYQKRRGKIRFWQWTTSRGGFSLGLQVRIQRWIRVIGCLTCPFRLRDLQNPPEQVQAPARHQLQVIPRAVEATTRARQRLRILKQARRHSRGLSQEALIQARLHWKLLSPRFPRGTAYICQLQAGSRPTSATPSLWSEPDPRVLLLPCPG